MKEHKTELSHLTNDQIKEAIYFMITTIGEFDGVNFANSAIKAREIGIYMMNLTEENILNEIIEKIQESEIVIYDPEQIKALFSRLSIENGNVPISAGEKAKYYGIITQYLGFEKATNISPDVPIPELYVDVKDGRVYSNLQELIQSTFRKIEFAKSLEIQKLPYEERKLARLNDINEKIDFKSKTGSKFLDEYIEYSKDKLNYIFDKKANNYVSKENEYPNIFIGKDNYYNELFKYLIEELVSLDKTKVSILYHYFHRHEYFSPNLTQDFYMNFVSKNFDIKISKVFQTNYKMDNLMNITVPNLEINFKSKNYRKI